MSRSPYLYQINASRGGVPKHAVDEAWVSVNGLQDDKHRNTVLHGGPDRAICLYSLEIISALQQESHTIFPGAAGENFTLAGLDWAHLQPGDQLTVGDDVRIEVTSFCEPCRRNAQWFQQGDYRRMDQERHPGWSRLYARVLSEGKVYRGDAVWVEAVSERKD